ncbi:hypothetical protein HOLleu_31045 [Holothuria leucospilota]|uniref:Arylamine N-acetyltransferase n=1 Tax=Holothuria leucospilota TaxID=206669 RepID=A0A9Q1BL70_HOLLE|nr:hypothetical protein HOLleu_31045 [Holothuria leucospilota]
MNILAYKSRGFMNVSYRAYSHTCPCTSPIAATRTLLTKKTDFITPRKNADVTFDTFSGAEHPPYPLSRREAFSFVENVLGLEHPDTLFKTDPIQNLTKIAERMKKVSPFTTMQFFDGSPFQINDEYCKGHMLHGHGGGCIFINPFTKALLEQLGYKTNDVPARVVASTDAFHISTLVCDLCYPGSLHLIEPGTVRPIFHPISLHFEQESTVYEVFGLRNKFFKRSDGNLVWCMEPFPKMLERLGDDEVIQDSAGKKWQIFLIYSLQEKKMGRYHFNKYWHKLIRGQGYIPPRTHGFVHNAYKDGDLINFFANKEKKFVQIMHEDSTEEVRELKKEELLTFFEDKFPGFPTRMLARAVRENFHISHVSPKS